MIVTIPARTVDNRSLDEMEAYYLARIEALRNEVKRLKENNKALQDEVDYCARLIARRYQ